MAKCLRCGKSIYPESPKICFYCGKDQSEGRDIDDKTPNFKEKMVLRYIISTYELIAYLDGAVDKLDTYCGDLLFHKITQLRLSSYPYAKPSEPTKWLPYKQEYPKIIPTAKYVHKWNLSVFKRFGLSNPIWGIIAFAVGLVVFLFALEESILYEKSSITSLLTAGGVLFGLLGVLHIMITMFIAYIKDSIQEETIQENISKAEVDRIKNSAEYITACKKIDDEYKAACERSETQYKKAQDVYYNETLPKYESDKAAWLTERDTEVEQLKQEFTMLSKRKATYKELHTNAQIRLVELFDTYRMIPSDYQDYDVVCKLYDIMDSTTYSIKEAIQLYNQEISNQIKYESLQEARRSADSLDAIAEQQYYQTGLMFAQCEMEYERLQHIKRFRR